MPTQAFFQKFYRAHYQGVFLFFRGRKFGIEEAHELTQETFLKAYRGLDDFRGEASEVTYLKAIAANVWRNALRDQKAGKRDAVLVSLSEDTGFAAAKEEPLSALLEKEAREALRLAIHDLPDRMRHCLMLRTYQDLKYREIASVMHLNIQTVKSMLGQARERLRERLSDYFTREDLHD